VLVFHCSHPPSTPSRPCFLFTRKLFAFIKFLPRLEVGRCPNYLRTFSPSCLLRFFLRLIRQRPRHHSFQQFYSIDWVSSRPCWVVSGIWASLGEFVTYFIFTPTPCPPYQFTTPNDQARSTLPLTVYPCPHPLRLNKSRTFSSTVAPSMLENSRFHRMNNFRD